MELEYEPYPGSPDQTSSTDPATTSVTKRAHSTGFTIGIGALILIPTVIGASGTFLIPIITGLVLLAVGPTMGIIFLARQHRLRTTQQQLVTPEFALPPDRQNAANFATFSQAFIFLSSIGLLIAGLGMLISLTSLLPETAAFGQGNAILGLLSIPILGVFALAAGSNWYNNTDILAGEAYALATGEGKPGLIKFTRTLNLATIWLYLIAMAGTAIWAGVSSALA